MLFNKKNIKGGVIMKKARKLLEELFDVQIQTLRLIRCPEEIIGTFQYKKSLVLQKTEEMGINGNGNVPFIPVIPRSYRTLYDLMAMIDVKAEILDPDDIIYIEKPPNIPYYIFDVDSRGEFTMGKSPEDAEKIIKKQGRLCHVPEEDIALCVHTDVLEHYSLFSVGSRHGGPGAVPVIHKGGRWYGPPRLSWEYRFYSYPKSFSSSCRCRVSFG